MHGKILIEKLENPANSIILFLKLLNFSIIMFFAIKLPIWIDEAYSLDTSGKSIEYAINQALGFEQQPPLYFIILNLWLRFNNSILFARLFSVICMVLVLYLLPKLCKRFLPGIHPVWITACMILNTFFIWSAIEIRVYALIILLSALLLLCFYDGYLAEIPKARARYLYIFLAIISLYTQYYLGFLLVANGITLLTLRRWQSFRSYFIGMICVGIFFLPMIFTVTSQVSISKENVTDNNAVNFIDVIQFIYQRTIAYIFRGEWEYNWIGKNKYFLFIFWLVNIIVFSEIIRKKTWQSIPIITIFSIGFTLIICFLILFLNLGKQPIASRHTLSLLIPMIFMFFSLIEIFVFPLLTTNLQKQIFLTFITFFIVFTQIISLYVMYYKPMTKHGDPYRVAQYLMAAEKPNQPILVFNAEAALPLAYYYSGKNLLIPLPKAEDFKAYDLREFVLNSETEIWDNLDKIPGNKEYVWLVENGVCKYGNYEYNCPLLENFVNKYFSVENNQEFAYSSRARLLHRKKNVEKSQ